MKPGIFYRDISIYNMTYRKKDGKITKYFRKSLHYWTEEMRPPDTGTYYMPNTYENYDARIRL